MKRIVVLSVLLFSVHGTEVAAADDAKITTRAEAIKAMEEVGASMDKQNEAFTRYADAAQKLAALYTTLDARTTKLAKLAAQCKNGCSKETLSQLEAEATAMQSAQMSFNAQYLNLEATMVAENKSYVALKGIMKTKHDTVKNSISNVR